MNFIINHISEILVAISAVVTAASAICALTPSTKDDTIVSKIRQAMDVLALNVGKAKNV